ncbi:MAG: branched-chain amino acid ABC transporter permease [Clostridia bacterium]|nr:branched-chain amino acid ABC transporter permease [Clostridia bacterium]
MKILLQQLVIGISIGSIYALIASGYALVYSLLDFSNWAHGEVCMLGAYCCFMAVKVAQFPFWLSCVLGVGGAVAVSLFNERFTYRRIRSNGSPNMFLMIAAMGLSTTYQNLATVIWGGKFKQMPKVFSKSSLNVGGVFIGTTDLLCLALTVIVLVILLLIINKTRFGLHVRAVACAGRTAGILGVRIDRVIALVFMLAGALAGLAGILYGMKYNVYPTMGNVGLKAFIASVIGGLGSVPGAIVGAVLLGLIETVASGYISSGLRDLISFSLLILILLVRPAGLMGVDVQDKA